MRRLFLVALSGTAACAGLLLIFVFFHRGAVNGSSGLILYRDGDVLYLLDPSGDHPRRLSPRGALVITAQWSPDGRKILQVQDGALWLSGPDGSRRGRLARGEISSSTWAPDSEHVAFVERIGLRNLLRIVAADTNPRTLVRFESGAEITGLAWAGPGESRPVTGAGIARGRSSWTSRRRNFEASAALWLVAAPGSATVGATWPGARTAAGMVSSGS